MRLLPALITALLCAPLVLPAQTAPKVPRRAPEFVLQFPNGSQKLLSSYRGKVIMLNFVHTTCPHCQRLSQDVSKLQTEYGPRGFQAIDVAWNDMAKELVPGFVRDYQVNYPVAYSDRAKVMDFLQISPDERTVVPQIVWIDKKGDIVSQTQATGETDQNVRSEDFWKQEIEKLTSEHQSVKRTVHSAAAHHVAAQQ